MDTETKIPEEKGPEKIDRKKLVIYSEIMKPKWQEMDSITAEKEY